MGFFLAFPGGRVPRYRSMFYCDRCIPKSDGDRMKFFHASAAIAFALSSISASAADYPAPKQGDWIARDFRFHTGEVMPELRLHYTTVGEPSGEPVLILHGTTGSGAKIGRASCRERV